jgi:hypothetical protein
MWNQPRSSLCSEKPLMTIRCWILHFVNFYVWMRRLTLHSSLNVAAATRNMYLVNVFQDLELMFFMYFVNVFWRTGRRHSIIFQSVSLLTWPASTSTTRPMKTWRTELQKQYTRTVKLSYIWTSKSLKCLWLWKKRKLSNNHLLVYLGQSWNAQL